MAMDPDHDHAFRKRSNCSPDTAARTGDMVFLMQPVTREKSQGAVGGTKSTELEGWG